MPITSVLDRVRSLFVISCMFCLLDKYQKLDPSFNSQRRAREFILVLLDFRLWRLEKKKKKKKKNGGGDKIKGIPYKKMHTSF